VLNLDWLPWADRGLALQVSYRTILPYAAVRVVERMGLADADPAPLRSCNYTALPYNIDVEFIEASAFTRHIYDYLSEDEYLGLQSFLLQYPEAGKVVPGSGGVRKLRWAVPGHGKRGGLRIIYYYRSRHDEIWMLTVYRKSEIENIPAHILRQIAEEIEDA
jgi:hypothetical protein